MTTAPTSALPAPPGRPAWWPVVVGVFLGYVWAALLLLPAVLVAGLLGLVPWDDGPGASGSLLPGPFVPDGAWSLLANAVVAFTVVAVAAWAVTRVVRERLGAPVSSPLVFGALAVTGYAPFLYLEGRFRLSGLFGLLVAAGLVRWLAVGDTPAASALARARGRLVAAGRWRRLVVGAAAAWALAVLLTAAYGLSHPLAAGYAVEHEPSGSVARTIGGEAVRLFDGPAGAGAAYELDLRNAGFAELEVSGVELGQASGFTLAGFTLSELPDGPAAARAIPGRESVFLALDLRLAACEGPGTSILRSVRVHYLVLGRAESQLLTLTPAPARRCPPSR
ncbi:MAG TPA: hypothetical protein VD704_11150 [Gaiellaceae bacterium]|nr:hypothetical protein [Gaiellaceae bacterium]